MCMSYRSLLLLPYLIFGWAPAYGMETMNLSHHLLGRNLQTDGGGLWSTITYDDFERGWGNFQEVSGSRDTTRSGRAKRAPQGSYSLKIRDNSGDKSSVFLRDSKDVSRFDDLRVSFSFYSHSMDRNEDFLLEYSSNNGAIWQEVQRFTVGSDFSNNGVTAKVVLFSEQNPLLNLSSNAAKIRFRCDASGNNDQIYLDEIRFEGLVGDEVEYSSAPSSIPSTSPSQSPTASPSSMPSTTSPSESPTASLSSMPSPSTSQSPTFSSSSTLPSSSSTAGPSTQPSSQPSRSATSTPSFTPSIDTILTGKPSSIPSSNPSSSPSTASSSSPTSMLEKEDICPKNRRYPPEKYSIEPIVDSNPTDDVEDDLYEVSSLAVSQQTDAAGNRFAYMVSDKKQLSLKVVQLADNIFGEHHHGSGKVVAEYTLFTEEPVTEADWEDIALGPCTDDSATSAYYTTEQVCIYIGNFGNNNERKRKDLSIYKFVEPSIEPGGPLDQIVDFATIDYVYGTGFTQAVNKYYDAEAMIVDWVGVEGDSMEKAGDIYVIVKGSCDAGVGKIPIQAHKNLGPGQSLSNSFDMPRVVDNSPPQGNLACGDSPFRSWTGADMRQDGRLMVLIRRGPPASVYFFSRTAWQPIAEALGAIPCDYIASTSVGLVNEVQHEAVAFLDPQGLRFADISECQSNDCSPTLYQYELEYPNSQFEQIVEPLTGWENITYDTFEGVDDPWGNFNSGGSNAVVANDNDTGGGDTCNGACACEGDWAALLNEDRGEASSIYHTNSTMCGAYDMLRVTFSFKFRDYDHLDTLFLELSLDGGSDYFIVGDWAHSVAESEAPNIVLDRAVCYQGKVVLTPSQFRTPVDDSFGDDVKLRFRNSGNAGNDRVYVDTIWFEGHADFISL